MVEHAAVNRAVVGSSPTRGAINCSTPPETAGFFLRRDSPHGGDEHACRTYALVFYTALVSIDQPISLNKSHPHSRQRNRTTVAPRMPAHPMRSNKGAATHGSDALKHSSESGNTHSVAQQPRNPYSTKPSIELATASTRPARTASAVASVPFLTASTEVAP